MLISNLFVSGPIHHFSRDVIKSDDAESKLKGQKIGILFESDFYEHEIWYYHYRFAEEGAEVHLLTRLWGQPSITFTGHEYKAPLECHEDFENMDDKILESYSAIIVPSGMVSDRLRYTEDLNKLPPATAFIKRAFAKENILKGIICHGMWLVAPVPELVRGRPVTCHNNLHGDVINMGVIYTDKDVVVDGDLVTGRSGAHCHLFAKKIIEILSGSYAETSSYVETRELCAGGKAR
jgi:protease I